ncbi:MAG: restriction endonuclease subunit S [Hyphomicrobiaceae bacterium]
MSINSGTKQTEFGEIPNDWTTTTVGDEFEIQLGKMLDREKNLGVSKPFLGNRAVQWGQIHLSDIGFIKLTRADLQRYRLRRGDLLVCEGGEVGRAAIWNCPIDECYYQKALHRLRPKKEYNVRLLLNLLRYFSDYGLLGNFVTQTSIAHLPKESFAKIPIPLPRPAEQEAISEALGDADALIDSLEQLIIKKRAIKQGAMQELLTGKKRLPGFEVKPRYKPTEIGEVPNDWQIDTLSSVAHEPMQNGVFFEPSKKGFGVSLVNVADLYGSSPIEVASLDLFDATTVEQGRFKVADGDLFFTRSSVVPSGIAHCNLISLKSEEIVVFDSHIIRFRANRRKVDPSFLFRFCVGSIARRYLVSHAKTGTMTTIDQGVLGGCPILLPSLTEQCAIANVLSDMDDEIAAIEAKLIKARAMKQGLMQELLTGRIRLV